MTRDAAAEMRPPIRVLRVITRLNIGGPSIQAIELTTRLGERGYRTWLAHGELGAGEGDMRYLLEGRPPDAWTTVGVPGLQRAVAPPADLLTVWRLVALIRRVRPHIIHTHLSKAGSLGRLAALAYNQTVRRGRRARLVHTYHGHVLDGYFSPAANRLFIGVERVLARVTDRIVAISPQIRRELLADHRIGRPEQYRVIPLGFDLDALTAIDDAARRLARVALQLPPDAHVLTTVGRLTAIKHQRLFLEAARLVGDRDSKASFLIVGDGELRQELEAQARAAGLLERTRFCGWRRDLATIYGASDVFLLTSRNEGTPVAVIESLAAGVPVVSTAVGGVPDVVTTDDVGLLAPFDDARALADHVTALLADPARRREMGLRGRSAVAGRYGLPRLLDDVDALYREVLA